VALACAPGSSFAIHVSEPIPYVRHLLVAAFIVIDVGRNQDEAIAALLHDAPPTSYGDALTRGGQPGGQGPVA
jgi:(p)ppGpp synthase/HD superfamily hydrolase